MTRSAAPSPEEFNRLVALFNTRRYAELENQVIIYGRSPIDFVKRMGLRP